MRLLTQGHERRRVHHEPATASQKHSIVVIVIYFLLSPFESQMQSTLGLDTSFGHFQRLSL